VKFTRAVALLAQISGRGSSDRVSGNGSQHVEMDRIGPVEVTHAAWSLIVRAGLSLITVLVAIALLRLLPALERRVIRWASAHDTVNATTSEIDRRQRVETLTRVTSSAAQAAVWTLTAVIVLGNLGIAIEPLIAGAGVAGLAVGFGAQSIVKDFFSGFFILLENQYDVGDMVTIGNTTGTVERMTMRITVLRDALGTAYFIPNSTITMVGNKTYGWARPTIDVQFSSNTLPSDARAALEAAASAASVDPQIKSYLLEPIAVEGPADFAPGTVTWRLAARVRAGHSPEARYAMIAATTAALVQRGFAPEAGVRGVWTRDAVASVR
jgi:small conductance mechanosensitive channel